jgi:hypothetical protein
MGFIYIRDQGRSELKKMAVKIRSLVEEIREKMRCDVDNPPVFNEDLFVEAYYGRDPIIAAFKRVLDENPEFLLLTCRISQ